MFDLRAVAAAAGGADLRGEAGQGLRVWAPLANRLGVWSLKAELEDLCFLVRVENPHCGEKNMDNATVIPLIG